MHNPKGSSVISFLLCSLLLSLAILLMASGTVFPKRDTPTDSPAGNRFTVILDPGHGGEDGGAVGHGEVYEKHLNLAIAK